MRQAIFTLFFVFSVLTLFSQKQDSTDVRRKEVNVDQKTNLSYGSKGWVFEYDNRFQMRMQWRFQFRFQSNSQDAFFYVREEDAPDGSFNVQRARLKVGGFAYKPYLKYYLEYDFPSGYLLNWEFTFAKWKGFQVKVGQWKIKYNIERFISSGKQQLVDRSISNRFFTFDRQIGMEFLGDLFTGSAASSSYNIGIFNGDGRMSENEDGNYLLLARYQWNIGRKPMKLFFSDLDREQKLRGFLALVYARNQSQYTRFSSDGGGKLPGYDIGNKNQYLINQLNFEYMLKYRGASLSGESHLKYIDDKINYQNSMIYGGYVMAGYFFSELMDFMPRQLEMVVRYGLVNNDDLFAHQINEYTVGFNWFFKGHLNKLTMDLSYIENQDFNPDEDNYRFRLQWDVSF